MGGQGRKEMVNLSKHTSLAILWNRDGVDCPCLLRNQFATCWAMVKQNYNIHNGSTSYGNTLIPRPLLPNFLVLINSFLLESLHYDALLQLMKINWVLSHSRVLIGCRFNLAFRNALSIWFLTQKLLTIWYFSTLCGENGLFRTRIVIVFFFSNIVCDNQKLKERKKVKRFTANAHISPSLSYLEQGP